MVGSTRQWDKTNKQWLVKVNNQWVPEGQQHLHRQPHDVAVTTTPGFDGTLGRVVTVVTATVPRETDGHEQAFREAITSLQYQALSLNCNGITGLTTQITDSELIATGTAVQLVAAPKQGGGVGGFVGVMVPLG